MVEDGVTSLVQLQTKISSAFELVSYRVPHDCDQDKLRQAYRMVKSSLVGLTVDEIEQRLTAMSILLTIPKDFDPEVMKLKRKVLAEKLAEWPADIVIDAIKAVEESCKFWPTLAEFVQHMDWKTRPEK